MNMLPVQWNFIPFIIIAITITILSVVIVETGVVPTSTAHSSPSLERNVNSDILISHNTGLYNASDKVKILTKENFNQEVVQRNHSILVEFYNSYCGHCRNFAPHYKNLAEQLYDWREIMPVAALDCAADENNDLCRYYEIMAYPTLKYFSPFYKSSPGNLGKTINITLFPIIEKILAELLSEENRTHDGIQLQSWPNFEIISNNIEKLYEQKAASYLAIIYDDEKTKSTVPKEAILHLSRWPDIEIRRTTDSSIFHINDTQYGMLIIDSNRKIYPYKIPEDSANEYVSVLKTFLKARNVTERPPLKHENDISEIDDQLLSNKTNDIIQYVKSNKHLVYQADLERAIHKIVFNEISKSVNITGLKFLALQDFLNVLDKYNPLGANGQAFIRRLNAYVKQQANVGAISGEEYRLEVKNSEALYNPIFSSNQYIGCIGSILNTRGFTCSLWQLFHHLTVQAAQNHSYQNHHHQDNTVQDDPIEVLQAIHGYVKHFFGCTECSNHFQTMALRRNLTNVSSKDEAILWLWAAHNEVNQRLAGDATEDPLFPKIQFPSPSSCFQCYNDLTNTSMSNYTDSKNIKWNKDNVLKFLKNIHNPLYVSRYGVNNIAVLPYRISTYSHDHDEHEHKEQVEHSYGYDVGDIEKLRSKRMVTNVFNDLDIRMGMLLYGFCIVMLVLAFKLFTFRGGYRKKSYYYHDMLGKA